MRRGIHVLGIVFLVLLLTALPVGLSVAHAGLFDLFPSWDSMMATLGTWVLNIFHKAVELTAWLLNGSITLGVARMSDFVGELQAIDFTWRTFRDIANIGFIFIILYAAIQTMLQAGNYQTKQVITKLVIVALLVNFSLFLTKAVVDVSNILALQFYNGMHAETETGAPVGLADIFRENLQLKTLYNVNSQEGRLTGVDFLEPQNVATITLVGSVFYLIASFILLAAAILFIIRFGLLILLMIVAPLAFAAVILPNTKKYFDRWLRTLLAQAFFAPVYLALTYVSVRIMNDPTFRETLYGGSMSENILGLGGPINVILAFGIVSLFLVASLVLGTSMGAAGSQTMMSWGKSAKRWGMDRAKGGATRVGMVPVRSAQTLGRETKSAYRGLRANIAQTMLKKDGGWGTAGRLAMGGTQRVDRLARQGREEISEAKKKYNDSSSLALQRMLKSPMMAGNRRDRAAITQILADRGDIDMEKIKDPEIIRTAQRTVDRKGGDSKKIAQSQWQFAQDDKERAEAIRGDKDKKIKPLAPENVEKLDEEKYFAKAGDDVRIAMYQTFNNQHINKLLNRNDNAPDVFFSKMLEAFKAKTGKPAKTVDDLVSWIGGRERDGGLENKRLAAWARSREGRDLLGEYISSGTEEGRSGSETARGTKSGATPPGGGWTTSAS